MFLFHPWPATNRPCRLRFGRKKIISLSCRSARQAFPPGDSCGRRILRTSRAPEDRNCRCLLRLNSRSFPCAAASCTFPASVPAHAIPARLWSVLTAAPRAPNLVLPACAHPGRVRVRHASWLIFSAASGLQIDSLPLGFVLENFALGKFAHRSGSVLFQFGHSRHMALCPAPPQPPTARQREPKTSPRRCQRPPSPSRRAHPRVWCRASAVASVPFQPLRQCWSVLLPPVTGC